jgi:HK97 family phage prohead protease
MTNKLERRLVTTEFRVVRNPGKPTKLVGYGSVFNSLSEDLGGFREQIARGAFDAALAKPPDCRCLFNHDPSAILGRTVAGTLRITQDNIGLRYECDVPDTTVGRDLLVSAARGDVTQSSFGFRVADDDDAEEWFDREGRSVPKWSINGVKRVIRKVSELFDVSPVTYPAYSASTVEARPEFFFPEGRPRCAAQAPDDDIAAAKTFSATESARKEARRQLELARIEDIRKSTKSAIF